MLRHTGALVLGLGGGLADLPLEGSEEVLAKLLGHIGLQVGLHEEAEALVVDGLVTEEEEDGGAPGHHGGAPGHHEGAELPVGVEIHALGPPHWAQQLQSPPQNRWLPKSQWLEVT